MEDYVLQWMHKALLKAKSEILLLREKIQIREHCALPTARHVYGYQAVAPTT